MKKYLLFLLIIIASCYQEGSIIQADGVCVSKEYKASWNEYNQVYDAASDTYQPRTYHHPEKFKTYFRTNDGNMFEVTEQIYYAEFRQGDSVSISYVELFNKKGVRVGTRFKSAILK